MKKILFVCKGHRNIAGAQLYLKQISLLFGKKSYELYFAMNQNDGLGFIEGISRKCNTAVIEYDWRHYTFLHSLAIGYRLFRNIKPDLIVFNSPDDKVLAPIWASYFTKISRRILVVHWAQSEKDLPLLSKSKLFGVRIPSRYAIKKRLIRSLSYRILDAIVFVNQSTHTAYRKLYKLSPSKCKTIYNGVDLDHYYQPQARDLMRKQLGIAPDECMLLATGNLTEVKGHRFLISAVHKLVAKGARIKCFIAGQGELEDDLSQQIRHLGISDWIQLLGYRTDIAELLAATDIFCMPSLNEAFGYSIVEAMAAGLPIVASKVGGIPEVISHGHEGILVAPANADLLSDAIEDLRLNTNLRQAMGKSSLARVRQQFDVDRMLQKSKKLYGEAL